MSDSLLTAEKSGFKTFTSSSSRSVYTRKSASKSAAAAAAAGSLSLTAKAESAYSFSITAVDTTGTPVSATVDWGDSTSSSGSLSGSTVTADHTYAKLGTNTVTVTVTDNLGTVDNTVTVTTAGSDYTAYGQIRVLDTRYGTGAAKAPVKARSITKVKFAGNGGIVIGRAEDNGQRVDWFPRTITDVEVFQQALTPGQVGALSGPQWRVLPGGGDMAA